MRNADLTGFFDRNYSVESLRRYKPAQEMYRMVAADAVAALSGRYPCAGCSWRNASKLRDGRREAGLSSRLCIQPVLFRCHRTW